MIETFFILLSTTLFIWVIFGLISPQSAAPFLKKPTRLKILGLFFTGTLIIGMFITPNEKSDPLLPYEETNEVLAKMNTFVNDTIYAPDLNGEEGNGSLAWRLKTDRGNIVAYAKENKLICLRWAGKDIYKNGEIIFNLSDYELTKNELKYIKNILENEIKRNLNDPNSVEFADLKEWQYEKSPQKIIIISWLRANNYYGAKIKKSFVAELSPKGDIIKIIQWL